VTGPRPFPKGFIWGTATSSYQVEGATEVDGRGASIWDAYCAQPGAIDDGTDGSVACDHFHRYKADVALMAELGVDAYRFSIAWPRIQATGRGVANEAGLDFYDRLIDTVLAAGIRPFATLYHWDLPVALHHQGGWPSRDVAKAFVDYAAIMAERLGDRVKDWTTHNEPWCIAHLGYELGKHAPGIRDPAASLAARHHLLLSHGWAVDALRSHVPDADVGIVLNLVPGFPASPSQADRDAHRSHDAHFNRWFLDPLFGRGYPTDGVADRRTWGHLPAEGPLPFVEPGDMDAIAAPIDYLGVNYYSRGVIRSSAVAEADNAPRTVHVAPASEHTDMGWEVYPKALTGLLTRLHQDYAPPVIYITECGAAFETGPIADGSVPDARRTAFLAGHFEAAQAAIDQDVPLGGFFVWSLLDNFEWDQGYLKRFGIVWVDYETQERTLKDSALFYRDVIARHGLPTPD
jgi:beta-glucosidase